MCKWFLSTPKGGGSSQASSQPRRPQGGGAEARRVRIECGSSKCKYSRMNPDNPYFYPGAKSRAQDTGLQPRIKGDQFTPNAGSGQKGRSGATPNDQEKKEASKAKTRAELDAMIGKGDAVAVMIDQVGLIEMQLNLTREEICRFMENDEFFEGFDVST
ncbi:hypothetical protein AA313_de0205439 [Arthrobotrys entomopaga]|nr:hypothetical protein AA313_de0205439 [Arthrobotrys entomopaga]